MQSSFCKRRSIEHEMLTFKVYSNRFLAAMLADRMLLENISDSEKKAVKMSVSREGAKFDPKIIEKWPVMTEFQLTFQVFR